ncbi:MAG: SoxR reducing system RseC family protein [Formivibrio sp.]|nr:SoxR reducing system RseC family protein [Formivibrio sp.]
MNAATSCSTPDRRFANAQVLSRVDGKVELAVTRQNACTACAESHRCGSRQETGRAQHVWLATDIPLKTGETVAVSMPEQAVWQAALLMYGLPLTGFISGLLLSAWLGDVAAILGALVGMAAGFLLAGRLSRHVSTPLQLFQQAPASISIQKTEE